MFTLLVCSVPDAMPMTLNTEHRAGLRQEWETQVAEVRTETEMLRHAADHQRAVREDQEVKRMRAQAVHKANAVRNYKPVDINPSSKPLTNPHTPRFSERLKSRSGKY